MPALYVKPREPPLLMGKFRGHNIVLDLEEAVPGEAVRMEPDTVPARGDRELPNDRRLAPALRMATKVMCEKS